MNYKMFEIYNKEVRVGKDKYNFIVLEKYIPGWGYKFAVGRRCPKFYEVRKNNKCVLSTTLHQTFYAYKRKILG